MNEFLQQFVIESREFVNQAVDGLLKLERSPKDAGCLDAVFRAFHTLKGGAGIVGFAAMEHAVHAAEEVLGEARAGRRDITPLLVGRCLACLDQVGHWLEIIATTEKLPESGAVEAEAIARQFADVAEGSSSGVAAGTADQAWIVEMLIRHQHRGKPNTAVRYTPSTDCFFQGEDPAARVATLPQLLAQELAAVNPWPSLSELDPYHCNLILMALTGSSTDSVRAHMQGYSGTCEIVTVGLADASVAAGKPTRLLQQILESQLALLTDDQPDHFVGRVASAGRVAANALMSASRDGDGLHVQKATRESLSKKSSQRLRGVLEELLSAESTMPTKLAEQLPVTPVSETTLRIDAARIDALVRLTGELTTAKNALGHTTVRAQTERSALASDLRDRLGEFTRLVERLQHAVLALRVLPLRTVLQRFPRVLREVSSTLGKPVVLHIEGDHTEADKTIVEMLFEPLLHALRNAVDHGIESPARRMESGKELVASIWIRASREADRVIIEVEDDGAGIDVERVRRVALERDVAPREALQAMDEAEVIGLLFTPGFSTATAVTELSGRGVGLDAVRAAIERVGGNVDLASRAGKGTTLRFSLPFSVMVTQVMTVEAGGQTFGIPLDALLETVRVPHSAISGIGAARVIIHRQRTIPLLDLAEELGRAHESQSKSVDVTVALASVAGEVIALRVDQVGDRLEVILKPLEGLLAGLRGVTGTTLLGDGRVLLVLDMGELRS